MAAIDIRNAQKAYSGLTIMHGVSMHIEDGEFVVLVGPSGCGKSTLLRMIAGLEDITGGEILIGDKVVNDLPAKDRDIAMVFQSYALYPHMSVEQNMAFSLRIARRPQDEIDRKVRAAADILGLGPLLDRKPGQLSGGQRQRVAMGRAIVRNPAVFLFDEPLSNLDAQLRVQMRAEIKALHQRLKTTTVYVTHDQVEAMTMADRIVVMNGGRVEQVGRPLELFDKPANLFVARFIGSPQMNLLDGKIENDGDEARFVAGEWSIPIAARHASLIGREMVLGFRPEDVVIVPSADQRTIYAKVVLVEPTGTETMINFDIGINQLTAVFHERIEVEPGDHLSIAINPTRVHLFDKSSSNRI